MNRKTYIAFLSAAVAAVVVGGSQKSMAQTLVWDSSGAAGSGAPVDGSGEWDLSTPNWTNGATNVVWPNSSATPTTPVASAQFGNPANTQANGVANPTLDEISLGAPIEVQDINLSTTTDNTSYFIDDADGGSLTVDGNITKSTNDGELQFELFGNNLTLSAGNHTIALNDTPGDVPELAINGSITGAGSVTLDNSSFASGSYGTLLYTEDNSYTGGTTLTSGRVVITSGGALGSGAVTIGSVGTLSVGGAGTHTGSMTINNPITIMRNTYTGGTNGDFGKNPDAFVSANTGNPSAVVTLAGQITIDSTDARIAANTSTIVIPNSLVAGTDVAAGTAVADFDGDFAGFVTLSGDNTAFGAAGNAIKLINGVELNVSSEANLGGPNSTLILTGGTVHPTGALASSGFMTNFGTHNLSTAAVNTGVDIDSGNTFTLNNFSGTAVGERGVGTMVFSGTDTFTGVPFFDAGVVNVNGSVTFGAFRLRSPMFNINDGASVTTTNSFSDIGSDSPDNATLNIFGSGQLTTANQDFNVSDNTGTQGTINMSGTSKLTTGGSTFVGKSVNGIGIINISGSATFTSSNTGAHVFVGENNGTGTINQSGGSIVIDRSGDFGFVVSDGRNGSGSGLYNLSAGTFSDPSGEIYVGEGANGHGTWTQTAGTVTFGNWFVVGREGALGTVTISGGTLTKTGTVGADPGSQFDIGEGGAKANTVNVNGTGVINEQAGEMWVGNNSSVGVLNVGTAAGALTNADATASVTVNNWFAIGRSGASTGTLNLYDGTVTQATNNWFDISGDGGSSTGTVNVFGGTLNALQVYLGENGSGHAILNINGGSVNITNNAIFANGNSVTGNLNLNGGTLTAFGFTAQNGGGTGKGTFFFNGGVLKASMNNTAFVGAKVTSVVSTGGAMINTNGKLVTIASALTHDTTLSGADGGLTKQGAGTLTLTGVETYTGPTAISAGTLQYSGNNNETLSSLSIANAAALDLSGGQTVTITAGLSGFLADIQTAYDKGAWDGTSSSSPIITSAFAATNHAVGIGYSTTASPALTLRLTYLGDANLDGVVNNTDILAMTPMSSGGTWATGDFNYDGAVNADDFALAQLGAVKSNGANITALVPEPASLALLGLPAILGFAPRRTRKHCN